MSAARALAPLQAVQALVGLGAIAAFTRLMSTEEFARFALALSVALSAHALLFSWAEAAACRYFATAKAGRRLADHYATLIAIAIVMGLAALAATSLAVTQFDLPADAAALAAFAAGATTLRFALRLARENDRAAQAFARYAAMESAYLAIGFAAGVAFLLVFDLGAAAPFAGLALGGAVILLIDAPRLLHRAKDGYATLARVRHYGAYGAPLALALAAELAVETLARVILLNQAGEPSLGAYAAAYSLARPLDLIFIGLSAGLAPLLLAAHEARGEAGAWAGASSAFARLIAVAIPGCVALMLMSEPLAALMIGAGLHIEAGLALPWLAIAALGSGLTVHYWSQAFQLAQRRGRRTAFMLIPGAAQLALTVVLARSHGAAGAAMAAAAAAVLGSIVLAWAGRPLMPLPLPAAALARTLAASAFMALCLAATPAPTGALGLALYAAAAALFYALGAVIFGVLDARPRAAAALRALAVRLDPPAAARAESQ
jgi:O-antigen/teichoic acid export membrane protein